MNCKHTRQLASYDVGALPAAERAALARHLPGCAACQRELAALRRTAQLLAQPMALADAPAPTWAAVQARLGARRPASSRLRQWSPVFAAALILIVVTGALLPLMQHGVTGFGGEADTYSQVQLAAAWDTPLADKAALGLAILAADDDSTLTEALD